MRTPEEKESWNAQEDPIALLVGLLAIPGVREVALRDLFGSIVYNADALIARERDTPGNSERQQWLRNVPVGGPPRDEPQT